MPNFLSPRILININIPILTIAFCLLLTENVFTNFILYRTCYLILGFNQTECAQLNDENRTDEIIELENKVQPVASTILMTRSLIEAILPAILSLFLGSWSDKFGRKPLLLLSTIGHCLTYISYTILSFYQYISPWYFIVASIFVSFSGGICVLFTAVYCYITDTVSIENRAFKIAVLQGMFFLGSFTGLLSSSPLLMATNYSVIFSISSLILLLSALYIYVFISESLNVTQENSTNKFLKLFDCNLVIDMVKTSTMRREKAKRAVIWIVLITLSLAMFIFQGTNRLNYLFFREKFHWLLNQFAVFNAIQSVFVVLGLVLGVYVWNKVLKIPEVILAIVSLLFNTIISLISALAKSEWQFYYIIIPCSMFVGMVSPMLRAVLSKNIPQEDLGKIFALASSLEAITPLVSTPLYTFIYEKTLNTNPGAYHFLTAGIHIFIIILMGILFVILRKHRESNRYDQIIEENPSLNADHTD